MIPGKPESIFEIGYMLFKRRSIFVLCIVLWALAVGMTMVYFIIFGNTCGSIVGSVFNRGKDDSNLSKWE